MGVDDDVESLASGIRMLIKDPAIDIMAGAR